MRRTEFGKIADDVAKYDYDKIFATYHTSTQVAEFLPKLCNSDKVVGIVDREGFLFKLNET